jgi:cobalt/nickel transport system permease protein
MQKGSTVHIPDGLMDPVAWVIGFVVAVPILFIVFRRLGRETDEDRMPFMAVLAAGIFVAQMLNFPVAGGTTGHLIGAALAVVLVGPAAAMAVLTVVIVIQSLFFGDGGITALGLNLLNMAVVAPLVSSLVYGASRRKLRASIFAASWLSVFLAAFATAIELSASFLISGGSYGITPFVALPAMLGYNAVIGVAEGIITVGIWAFIQQVAPEIAKAGKEEVAQ